MNISTSVLYFSAVTGEYFCAIHRQYLKGQTLEFRRLNMYVKKKIQNAIKAQNILGVEAVG